MIRTPASITYEHVKLALRHPVNHNCCDCILVASVLAGTAASAIQRLPLDASGLVANIIREGGKFIAHFECTIYGDRLVPEMKHLAGFGKVPCETCLGCNTCDNSIIVSIPMSELDMATISAALRLCRGLDAGRVKYRTDSDREAGARLLFSSYLQCRAYSGMPETPSVQAPVAI